MLHTILCAVGAAVSSVAFGIRSNMLRSEVESWPSAPTLVWLVNFVVSVGLGAYVVAVIEGYAPSSAEFWLMVVLSLYSVVYLVNLTRQVRESNTQ